MEINREILISFLDGYDLCFTCVKNKSKAVQAFGDDPEGFDMILMIQLPVLDGYCATRHIRAMEPSNVKPFI